MDTLTNKKDPKTEKGRHGDPCESSSSDIDIYLCSVDREHTYILTIFKETILSNNSLEQKVD